MKPPIVFPQPWIKNVALTVEKTGIVSLPDEYTAFRDDDLTIGLKDRTGSLVLQLSAPVYRKYEWNGMAKSMEPVAVLWFHSDLNALHDVRRAIAAWYKTLTGRTF